MRLVGVQPRLPGTQNTGIQHPTFRPPPAQSGGIQPSGNQNPDGHPHEIQPPVIQHAFQPPVSQPVAVQPSDPHPHAVQPDNQPPAIQLSDIQPPDDQPPEIQPDLQPTNFEVASSVTSVGGANDISTNQPNSGNASGRSINSNICCDLQLLVHILVQLNIFLLF